MIFKIHDNCEIRYKEISSAELGRKKSSNLTHIGLFENSLNFLPKESISKTAHLIYENQSEELLCLIDYINNNRSPKIRKGTSLETKYMNSITNRIIEIAKTAPNTKWYITWFGLDNEDLVFLLFKENDTFYNQIRSIIGSNIKSRGMIAKTESIISYFYKILEKSNSSYLEELELATQTNDESVISKRISPRRIDIDKANEYFKNVGQKGEELINVYLSKQKKLNLISDFEWMNKSRESGLPYDFQIKYSDNIFYSDVKSTQYSFEQKMIFSHGELAFIHHNQYQVHRVFNMKEQPTLRVCNNMNAVIPSYLPFYEDFKNKIQKEQFKIHNLKIGIPTNLKYLEFDDDIIL